MGAMGGFSPFIWVFNGELRGNSSVHFTVHHQHLVPYFVLVISLFNNKLSKRVVVLLIVNVHQLLRV